MTIDLKTLTDVKVIHTVRLPIWATIKMHVDAPLPDYVIPRAKISAQLYTAEIDAHVYEQLLKDERVVAVEVNRALALP